MIVGLGIDILEIERIAEAYDRYRERFLRKVLTEGERAYCRQFQNIIPEVAARFAAKEAFSKVIGTGMAKGVHWQNIEVVKDRGKAPRLVPRGVAADHAKALGINNIHMSISHSDDYVAVVVVGEKL